MALADRSGDPIGKDEVEAVLINLAHALQGRRG